MPITEKHCWKCDKTKATSQFARDKNRGDGLCPVCKDCQREYHRNYYLSRREEMRKQYQEKRKAGNHPEKASEAKTLIRSKRQDIAPKSQATTHPKKQRLGCKDLALRYWINLGGSPIGFDKTWKRLEK